MFAGSLGLACALAAQAPALPAHKATDSTATGPHFRIEAHFEDDALAKAALETAESTWPISTALFGEIQLLPDERLVIHLYRNSADYDRVEQALTQGVFKGRCGFADPLRRAAHVALQPHLSDVALARVGLTTLTRSTIAHEAAHLACASAWFNAATLPAWFAEGSAMWVAEETLVRGGWVAKLLEEPRFSTDATTVQRLQAATKRPMIADVFRSNVGELASADCYPLWSHTFRFLHDGRHSATFEKLIGIARTTPRGPDHGASMARLARVLFDGDAGMAKLDAEFAGYVMELVPLWDGWGLEIGTNADVWTQAAFASSAAQTFRTEEVGTASYQLSGACEVFPGGVQQFHVLLGRTDSGFVSVAFDASGEGATVFDYDNRRESAAMWKQLAHFVAFVKRGWSRDAKVRFALSVDKTKLGIRVDGWLIGELQIADHPLHGAWGLSLSAASAGVWTDVALKRL